MKPASSALESLLGSAQFWMADCYIIEFTNGFIGHYTNADYSITDQATGHVYAPGPKIGRTQVKFHVGAQVDELDITIGASPTDLIDGTQWFQAMQEGLFDSAIITLNRAFMATAGDTSAGLLTIFYGTVATCTVDRQKAIVKATTYLDLLNLNMPFRLFQAGCKYALYSVDCTLVKSAFAVAGTVGASPPNSITVVTSGVSQATGYFSLGTMTFTSGLMDGESYPIQSSTNYGSYSQFNTMFPMSHTPNPGDTFNAYPGCDKQLITCQTKFSNGINFGGYPFIPVPETAI